MQEDKDKGNREDQKKKTKMKAKKRKNNLHRQAMMPTLLKGVVSEKEHVTVVEKQDIFHQIALMQLALQRVNGIARQLPTTCVQKHMRVLKEIKDHREKMMIIHRQ